METPAAAHLAWAHAAVGGCLIGLAAAALYLLHGRIAGVSGVLDGAVAAAPADRGWRALFLAGLLVGGALFTWSEPGLLPAAMVRGPLWLALSGLLVGFGTRMGGGCTSGHGICGIARLSPRSFAATLTFMATGAATCFLLNHVLGASPSGPGAP